MSSLMDGSKDVLGQISSKLGAQMDPSSIDPVQAEEVEKKLVDSCNAFILKTTELAAKSDPCMQMSTVKD